MMRTAALLVVAAVAALLVAGAAAGLRSASMRRTYVYVDAAGHATVSPTGSAATAAAVIEYTPAMDSIGWDVLNVTTNALMDDAVQAYAAGFGEGFATQAASWAEWLDNFGAYANGTRIPINTAIPPVVAQFIEENWRWAEAQVNANNATSDYWYQVGLVMRQWQGMYEGINAAAPEAEQMSFLMVQYTTLIGDLYDLVPALTGPAPGAKDWRDMAKSEFDLWFGSKTHCSSLVKLADDLSDLYFSHVTWSTFNTMLRMYKHYTLNFASARGAASKTVSFSGYPAAISSIDDFYVTDTGLYVTETSLGILNTSIYKGNIRPQTLMYWMRVSVANRMATTAPEWTSIYARERSGTYCGQYQVLDLKLFTPGRALPPNTMWIIEEVPGMVAPLDVTAILSFGYFPSYNVPMNRTLFVAAGYEEAVQKHGPEMNSYQGCVRAQIFRRDQANVRDMADMKFLMQYNNYQNDPISKGNPVYAISSRADLQVPARQAFGAIDCKVSSWRRYQSGAEVEAFSGPTPQQPIFDFSRSNITVGAQPHFGIPDVFNFEWQLFKPFL